MSTSPTDDTIATTAWLHRRAGLGLHPDDARQLASDADPVATLTASVAADDLPDPWSGQTLETGGEGQRAAVRGWLAHLVGSTNPFIDRRSFVLHGWLVSSLGGAPPMTIAGQIRRFMTDGGGSYPDLLRSITTDPAMLLYLDGATSTAAAPNENYARELLELFSLGNGVSGAPRPYDEGDVAAAAAALTGWTVDRRTAATRFVPRRHDDRPRRLLGVDGVHDVDSVIDAIVTHPEHDRFVAERIAREYVGAVGPEGQTAPDDDVVDDLADAYRTSGRRLDDTIIAAIRIAADPGRSHTIVSAPIPWLVAATRALGVGSIDTARGARGFFLSMGQVPLYPPSVAGWPGEHRWLTTSALIARTNVAAGVVAAARPTEPTVVAAGDGDLDALAIALGIREPFSTATSAAIRGGADPAARLTLALVSPEYLLT